MFVHLLETCTNTNTNNQSPQLANDTDTVFVYATVIAIIPAIDIAADASS